MVSIIIPVYNAEKYITETIQSVLASTYSDIEVVCMDDGSTRGRPVSGSTLSDILNWVAIIEATPSMRPEAAHLSSVS